MGKQVSITECRQCPRCSGRGQVAVTGEYLKTLRKVRGLKEPVTGADLARDMGVNDTAMNNRLKRLEDFGFLESAWDGPRRYYVACK